MSEGSFSTRRRGRGAIKTTDTYKAEGWPKHCIHCGTKTRPSHTKAADWPGTVAAENSDGHCTRCTLGRRYSGTGQKGGTIKRTPEQEAEMIRLARADLDAMWRDRRARGIDPDGMFFPGEKPIKHQHPALEGQAAPTSEHAVEGAPLGICRNGHPYDKVDSLGHRRCTHCMAKNGKQAQKRMTAKRTSTSTTVKDGEMGTCRKGHPYTKVTARGMKRCSVCEREAKRDIRARNRAAGLRVV